MNPQSSPWRQPGVIAVIAVIVLINLVVDWLWFKPTNFVLFVIVEAVVLGGIFWLASRRHRS
jgi:Flp pilus assembly protein TadB